MLRLCIGLVAGGLLLAACGGSSKVSHGQLKGQVVPLAAPANGDLVFDKQVLHVKAGTVTIVLTNDSPEVHNVTVADDSGVLGATSTFQGGKQAMTVTLKRGSYRFYCSVAGHEAAGMKGAVVVD
jgi:plastocyanin